MKRADYWHVLLKKVAEKSNLKIVTGKGATSGT